MSEIDKPASQPAGDHPGEVPAPSSPVAPVWPSQTEPSGEPAKPAETFPAAAVGQPEQVSGYEAAQPVSAPAATGDTAPGHVASAATETSPSYPVAGSGYTPSAAAGDTASQPVSGSAYTPGSAAGDTVSQPVSGSAYTPGSAVGDAAAQPVSGAAYTPGQAPGQSGYAGQPQAGYASGGYGTGYGEPASGVPAGGYAPGSGPASGVPAGGYPAGGYPGVPNQGPAWTPPTTKKRVPTAVKVVATVSAAGLLALCAGVSGALIATAIDRNGGITLPVSTDTAPVINENSVAGVAAKIQPSVVSIATGSGEGSGVILTEDGYILTNNHVVESARGGSVTVTLATGKKIQAKVVGTDPRTDLAVVKADTTGLTPATLADSGKVNVGDTVLAVGSPLGLQGSVTKGIISAKDRTIRAGESGTSLSGLLQTDAPINPGNSGGALVDMNGNVIGINTAIATSGSGEGNIGVGFAIPSSKAKTVAEQLMKGAKVSHPFLGVSVTAEETGGAKISAISPNSPAAEAGLVVGDVITKFGDTVVNDSDDLVSAVQSGTVGQKVTVEYTRNGEQKTATVTLKEAS